MSASFFSLSFPPKEGLVYTRVGKASQVVLVVKNPLAKAGDTGLIPAGESPLLSRSGGEKGLRGSGAGTLGVPLGGTQRVGGLLGVAGRL